MKYFQSKLECYFEVLNENESKIIFERSISDNEVSLYVIFPLASIFTYYAIYSMTLKPKKSTWNLDARWLSQNPKLQPLVHGLFSVVSQYIRAIRVFRVQKEDVVQR